MIDAKRIPRPAPARLAVDVPIRTVSEANSHEHWRYRQTRAKRQRTAVVLMLSGRLMPSLPAVVTMTRLSPRQLDDDNLAGSMKHVRDEVARCLGIDDRDPRVKWVTAQDRAKGYAVRVEIESV